MSQLTASAGSSFYIYYYRSQDMIDLYSHLRIREWVTTATVVVRITRKWEEECDDRGGERQGQGINYVRISLTDYPERPVDKSHISSDQIQGFHKAPMRGPYILYLENFRIIRYS